MDRPKEPWISLRGMGWWRFSEKPAWLNAGCVASDYLQGMISPFWKGTLSLKTDDFYTLAVIKELLNTYMEKMILLLLPNFLTLGDN